jgi:PhoH-like ATPase
VRVKNKTFVLDTNVLIHDPEAFMKFPRCRVVIPLTVIEELDHLKKNPAEVGKNARTAVRLIEEWVQSKSGNLHEGVPLENQSSLRVVIPKRFSDELLADPTNQDNWIVMTCVELKKTGTHVVFVSKDFAARVKALSFGIEAQDYENFKVEYETLYSGYAELKLPKEFMDLVRKDGALAFEKIPSDLRSSLWLGRAAPIANEYFRLFDEGNGELYARYDAKRGALVELAALPKSIWGVKPRSPQQRCALDALLDDNIKLVTLVGTAGTGKTLLALAAGLRKVFDESTYSKILISRPIVPLGKDIGFLPGSKEEKLFHWMQPIYDNLEFLCQSEDGDSADVHRWVLESRKIEMEAVTFIRGRSLPKIFFIIDEAQNLTPHEVKTIISRAAEGTKVVLTGDPTQIDNPYLDRDFNAMTYTVGRFQQQGLYGHTTLAKTERSELAALAAQIM